MNIGSVRLFLEVVEAGSFSKAAARRQTVQSHISRQISEFEGGFGGPLFSRTGRGVALTELGARATVRLRSAAPSSHRSLRKARSSTSPVRQT